MGAPMGVVFGFIAGVIGAAVWAAIAYYGNIEIGYLAWGIGGAVGFAVAAGSGKGSPAMGVAAVLITVASICGGKYASSEAFIQKELAEVKENYMAENDAKLSNEEFLVSYLADDVILEQEEAGKETAWPDGVDPSMAVGEADYPVSIWKKAQSRWDAMDDAACEEHKVAVRGRLEANFDIYISSVLADVREEGFFSTFGPMDLLFFGLAIVTAWKLAGIEEEAVSEEPIMPVA